MNTYFDNVILKLIIVKRIKNSYASRLDNVESVKNQNVLAIEFYAQFGDREMVT